ncbi:16S rRNA (guanine(527)-N(7))-methyltransferase RsmG [Indioceanicola profundi]|uniref:16S rRNA (guanine(527)-N(7))-methyltransferase RsmG n=1 Tax=Indioceanicola profundi TaxID=2220096 RepID=UPI000E6AB89D|nr:16S rRNA (guanine(527)-N(7))-methyltransferase RsmG [Indioceanicola profundi]
MTPADFQSLFGVPRETLDRLATYEALLRKWNPTINLVSRTTLADAWARHFADSAQLFALVPPVTHTLVDLGSGAGFPGLVLAILGVPEVHLVESDQRKGAFLREVARATGAPVTVHTARIEAAKVPSADVVSARALADLSDLLPMAVRILKPGGICLFPKGKTAADELTRAGDSWTMRVERFPSRTDPAATLLRLSDISRRD